jgi:hypothetical protein
MVVVAIVAVLVGGMVLARRQGVYQVRAEFYAQEEQVAARRLRHWTQEVVRFSGRSQSDEQRRLADVMVDYSRNRAAHHARLKVKYERGARYPWLPIVPDSPSPDGVTPPL